MTRIDILQTVGVIGIAISAIGVVLAESSIMDRVNKKIAKDIVDERTLGQRQTFKDLEKAKDELNDFEQVINERASKAISESKEITEIDEKITKQLKKDPTADVSQLRNRRKEIVNGFINVEREKERETVCYLEGEVKVLQHEANDILRAESVKRSEKDIQSEFIEECIYSGYTKAGVLTVGLTPIIFVVILSYVYVKKLYTLAKYLR